MLRCMLICGERVVSDEPRMRSGSWDDSRLEQSQRVVSSEESWYSGGSDQELSSGDETEKREVPVTK
jgi:hypothetical protein